MKRDGRENSENHDALAESIEALAVLIDAGVRPDSAWTHVGRSTRYRPCSLVARAIELGATPAEALVRIAQREPNLQPLAAVWIIADAAGAAVSTALRSLVESLRNTADTARDIEASVAGPRSTARLMTFLPGIGILMAFGMGIDVIGVLVGSPLGWVLFGTGVGLFLLGHVWTVRMIRAASAVPTFVGTYLDVLVVALSGGFSPHRAHELLEEVSTLVTFHQRDRDLADRVITMSEQVGAPVGELLRSASRQERHRVRLHGRIRAAQLSVRLLLPLGLCTLPAFICLGVMPVIIGLLSSTAVIPGATLPNTD